MLSETTLFQLFAAFINVNIYYRNCCSKCFALINLATPLRRQSGPSKQSFQTILMRSWQVFTAEHLVLGSWGNSEQLWLPTKTGHFPINHQKWVVFFCQHCLCFFLQAGSTVCGEPPPLGVGDRKLWCQRHHSGAPEQRSGCGVVGQTQVSTTTPNWNSLFAVFYNTEADISLRA